MSKLIDRSYAESHTEEIIDAIKKGALFIYPTDTIYGLGCNAVNKSSVLKIRHLKKRFDKPFSIIAPGKGWIKKHTEAPGEALEKLPGPYTLIVKWKKKSPLAPDVNTRNNTIGIRVPDHWFSHIIEKANVPFLTTSVNISGEKHMESLDEIPATILDTLDYVVYEGPKKGEPSIKLNFVDKSS